MDTVEQLLAHFVCDLQIRSIPPDAIIIVRRMLLASVGAGIAGATEDGIAAVREFLCHSGGAREATTFVFGDKLPARAAAQFNGTLCRALDFCDAMAPGPHFGSALIPAALACAELAGGCTGAEFMAALVVGAELSSRFNLTEAQYNGFDPTGIVSGFAATAAASRILRLTPTQTLNAMALAFNRCGGSFQSHVDGSLAVRIVQGWVAATGVECAQLAKKGVTGPQNYITGHYGYKHLYGRDTLDPERLVAELGTHWQLKNMMFKKYPSCGVTQGVTELAIDLAHAHPNIAHDIESIEIHLPPYSYRLVGHKFHIGNNPRVDAQFSAAYCAANALVRGASRLVHFTAEKVVDTVIGDLIERTQVISDRKMESRGLTAVDMTVITKSGSMIKRSLDIAPGFPGAELSTEEHFARFADCMKYAPFPLGDTQISGYLNAVAHMEKVSDVREIVPILLSQSSLPLA